MSQLPLPQLPFDCIDEIFGYLKDDKATLRSTLLVNRIWSENSVRYLWRDVSDYNIFNIRTLVACLPKESKEILRDNDINIPTPTTKSPTYNYSSYCKILSMDRIKRLTDRLLDDKSTPLPKLNDNTRIVAQEIFKLFMNQVYSLKRLSCWRSLNITLTFTIYPAEIGLKNLSELCCRSDLHPEFYFQLIQTSRLIQSITIRFEQKVSNGLLDLILNQKYLKYLKMIHYEDCESMENVIIPSLAKISNSLIKFNLHEEGNYTPLSFISNFTNLQELELTFDHNYASEAFKSLQNVTFSQLHVFKIRIGIPDDGLVNFLEKNGKNLKELYLGEQGINDNLTNLSISRFCPNLRKLSVRLRSNEMETLKMIFANCKLLESVKIWCSGVFFSEKEAFEVILNYSPKTLCELALHLYHVLNPVLLPDELETFFINWSNRTPQKSISLDIVNYYILH